MRIQRHFCGKLEVRAVEEKGDDSIGVIEGYAAVFDSWSNQLGWFKEKIRAGAFTETLSRGDDVRALLNHNSSMILGRRSAKTLELKQDDKGLFFRISVPDSTVGRDTLVSVRRGDLSSASFAFGTVDDEWNQRTEDSKTVYERELITADLFDVSIVTFPAYDETSAEARSLFAPTVEEAQKRLNVNPFAQRDRIIAAHNRLMSMLNV